MALSDGRSSSPLQMLSRQNVNQNWLFVGIIMTALIAFEMFNYSTTDYALSDLLGNLKFIGIPWATILAVAFCGIDFAGVARLFTPQQGSDEPKEVWYLFGAWLLAATMNAILTWWGISMAILSHNVQSTSIMDPNTLTKDYTGLRCHYGLVDSNLDHRDTLDCRRPFVSWQWHPRAPAISGTKQGVVYQ
jgi:hypothetical protein